MQLPCQKPMFGQIKWGVRNETITKEILPITTLTFLKYNLSIRTSYE